MKKGTGISLIIAAWVVGFFVGREFPRHHFQPLGVGWVLLDTSTGKTCDLRAPQSPTNPIDKALSEPGLTPSTPSGLPRCNN